jgi:hypothetical protein
MYNCQRDEHSASGGHEYFVLGFNRSTCSGDDALDRLGERSA